MAREERIFAVQGPPVIYVIAENEADALEVAAGSGEEEGFEAVEATEVHRLEDVDPEWHDSYPYLREDRDPYVDLTLRQIFAQEDR